MVHGPRLYPLNILKLNVAHNLLLYGYKAIQSVREMSANILHNLLLYRVIHEECHSFRELICHVMLMKKVHMNMGPIFHISGDMRSTIFEIEL